MNEMKKLIFILYLLTGASITMMAQDESEIADYIDRFKQLAMTEQIRTGVPASIKLAQGIYETGGGKSDLALKAHNHFGIKCKTTWKGETFLHDDDQKQECFRKYTSDEDSYKDHSDFLKGNLRYSPLFKLEITDYVGWANGLKRAGYATNPVYVKRITSMVEKYNLQQYTYEAMASPMPLEDKSSFNRPKEVIPEVDAIPSKYKPVEETVYQGLKGFWGKKGQALLGPASDLNIRYAKLLALNDMDNIPLPHDMFIYTEKKRRIGMTEFHIVSKDEDMHLISQKEAIALEYLYKYNNLSQGEEPEVGEKLFLRYKSLEGTPRIKGNFLTTLNKEARPKIEQPEKVIKNEQVVVNAKETQIEKEVEVVIEKPLNVEEVVIETTKPIEAEEFTATKPSSTNIETIEATELKSSETLAESNNESTVENEKIRDAEKAMLMEKLLNSNPIDGSEKAVVHVDELPKRKIVASAIEKEISQKKEVIIAKEEKLDINDVQAIEKPQPKQKDSPIVEPTVYTPQTSPTKNYNERGVDDSTKDLKRKFDKVIYAPKRPKRMDTTKQVVTPKPDQIKKPVEVKTVDVPAKKIETLVKKDTAKKVDDKKGTTNTKIGTSTKKVEEKKKEVEVKKKEPIKKVVDKKVADKKGTGKKEISKKDKSTEMKKTAVDKKKKQSDKEVIKKKK